MRVIVFAIATVVLMGGLAARNHYRYHRRRRWE